MDDKLEHDALKIFSDTANGVVNESHFLEVFTEFVEIYTIEQERARKPRAKKVQHDDAVLHCYEMIQDWYDTGMNVILPRHALELSNWIACHPRAFCWAVLLRHAHKGRENVLLPSEKKNKRKRRKA